MSIGTIRPSLKVTIETAKQNLRISDREMTKILKATGADPATGKGLSEGEAEHLRALHTELTAETFVRGVTALPETVARLTEFMKAFDALGADPVTPIHPPALSVLSPARQAQILTALGNLERQGLVDMTNGPYKAPGSQNFLKEAISGSVGARQVTAFVPLGAMSPTAPPDANSVNTVIVEVREVFTNLVWHVELNLATIDNAPPVTIGNNPPAMGVPLSKEQLLDGFKAVGGFKETDGKPVFTPMENAPQFVTDLIRAAPANVIAIGPRARGITIPVPEHVANGHMALGYQLAVVDPADRQLKGLVFRGRSETDLVGFAFATMDQMSKQPV